MITYAIQDSPCGELLIDGDDFADAVIQHVSTAGGRNGDKTGITVHVDLEGGNGKYPFRAVAIVPQGGSQARQEVIYGREHRKMGRPRIGGEVLVRLGDLLEDVDAYASEHGLSRAEVIRSALGEFLTSARPYALTFRDISTGQRETDSRYATLGAAVEALRGMQADDYERQQYRGLPSIQPRVEHDGHPVDVEAYAD